MCLARGCTFGRKDVYAHPCPQLTVNTVGPKEETPSSPHLGGAPTPHPPPWDLQTILVSDQVPIYVMWSFPSYREFFPTDFWIFHYRQFIHLHRTTSFTPPFKKRNRAAKRKEAQIGATEVHFDHQGSRCIFFKIF